MPSPLPLTAPLRSYLLDLRFLDAALRAGGHGDLAADVARAVEELRAKEAEDAALEERVLDAEAKLAGKDAALDEIYKQASSALREHHPTEYGRFFPKPPARVAEGDLAEEIDAVRALLAEMTTLPEDDAVRRDLRPRLEGALAEVEGALREKEELLNGVAGARRALEGVRATANNLRERIHTRLTDATHDKKTPDKFFRR